MSKTSLQSVTRCNVYLYVPHNVAVFQQGHLWHDVTRLCQFVPCRQSGMVIAAYPAKVPGGQIIRGWVLYRPHTLELVWSASQVVTIVDIDVEDALAWYQKTKERWVGVGVDLREYAQHVVPR